MGLLAATAWTDVLPPPWVTVFFDNLDKFPDYTFFLFPTDQAGAFQRVSARKPSSYNTGLAFNPSGRLYAVKGPLPAKPNDRIFSDPTLPHSDMIFVDSPNNVELHYRIKAIEAAAIKLELVSKRLSPVEYQPVHRPH